MGVSSVQCSFNGAATRGETAEALDLYSRSFTRYEESYHHWEGSNPPFSYRGRWTPVRTWLASEGSYRATRDLGAAVTLSFGTTGLVWIATTGPGFGIARGDPR